MRRPLLAALATSGFLMAQQPVTPTAEAVGSPRGTEWQGYNIHQSFEVGLRTTEVTGSRDRYRSDVNYRNGLRLLSSKVDIYSREGNGRLFDQLNFSTLGLGNDPYQYASLRVEKNSLYRYDLLWRQSDYFNPALTIAGGQHRQDTVRRLQDHNLTILPGRALSLFGGYTRNNQDGAGLTTINLFDQHRGTEFPLFSDIRRQQNEYRVGGEAKLGGLKLMVIRNWEFFKDDTRDFTNGASTPNDPLSRTTLTRLNRGQPNHGSSPGWRANLFTEKLKWIALNARFTWVDGTRDFVTDETALGTDRLGAARNRQTIVTGNARRPMLSANATVSIFPTERLTVTNHTSFTQSRMEGDIRFAELNNQTLGINFNEFQFLGLRTISNSTDAQYQITSRASVHGGYHYADRRVRSVQDEIRTEQSNRLSAGMLGFRFRPVSGLSINLDGELGRADNPFYTISEKNYHGLSSRVQYKHRTVTLSTQFKSNYNFNSVSLFAHSARSRQYAFDGSWQAAKWLSLDASYSKLHLDTLTGIAYFANLALIDTNRSWYVSNLHTVFAGLRTNMRGRADLFAGWSRVQDRGGPNRVVTLPALTAAQNFPVIYHSPMVRFSVPINPKIRWNAGYQFYGYGERLMPIQNYRGHTAYTSLLWAF